MKYSLIIFLAGFFLSCSSEKTSTPEESDIIQVLDSWHQAAADADFDQYFSFFRDEESIFMGTDATERWTVAEFKPWSKPFFDRGRAWSFTGHDRHIYFSADGNIAWFDEELDTPNLGPSRGTGVMEFTSDGWKIVHYNLTVPIPNDIVDEVVVKIDSVLNR
ncbi:nuclear transport factor 2 family protein [Fulvivirga sedimenti]|uniref:Nuclear transport factor 2 family protein n=1 Tax=Fulvivirga sedimenti TaxID=2879465 RepID=A0A9X1HM77_9BACT|nr:nuclear transport factor 2 family protein [Fulvivirga sedimenti]MCA6074451.1 nuclear transport factor 2 family protein [Fulvivirga sedimenti]